MFNHQYNFDIEIPKEAISKEKHDKIFKNLLENKIIIGLAGYGKSGKDSIAESFVNNYGFYRVAFADNLKSEMNKYLKEKVFNYLEGYNGIYTIDQGETDTELHGGLELIDGRFITIDDIDFQTEDIVLKKKLRPFIIWYGEKMREINGSYYWMNQALKIDANGHDKIIFSDVRRKKELEIFEGSNIFNNRTREMFATATCYEMSDMPVKSYSTLLFHVSQLGLKDNDILTLEAIRIAQEKWLFDDIFYIDPRIPDKNGFRKKIIKNQVDNIAKKFKIKKEDKTISPRQMKIKLN